MPTIRSWALTRGFALHPGTKNRYEIRYTSTQHRPPSRLVNDHGQVSGTHRQIQNTRNQDQMASLQVNAHVRVFGTHRLEAMPRTYPRPLRGLRIRALRPEGQLGSITGLPGSAPPWIRVPTSRYTLCHRNVL